MQPRVLVLYDSEEMGTLVADILRGLGCIPDCRPRDGLDIDAVAADAPALICVELGWDAGRERSVTVLEALRADPRTAAVPMMACSADLDGLRARRADFKRLRVTTIRKPFTLDRLEQAVVKALSHGSPRAPSTG